MDNQSHKDQKSQQDIEYPQKASRLGPTIDLKGEISGQDHLIVEGRVQGSIEIQGKTIIIEQEAVVEADISVRDALIAGKLSGNLTAAGKVVITSTGRMKGDISATRISIADGSQFKGKIKILPLA